MSTRIAIQVRPISTWPGERTPDTRRKRHPFRRTTAGSGSWSRTDVPWSDTVSLLERELRALGASLVVIEADFGEHQLRNDGWPYANARPASPAVILSFNSRHGPLRYPCDTFTDWQANVRAIALALEALRKVDRYGVTKRGEQYTGWRKLPPQGGSTPTMDVHAAAVFMVAAEGRGGDPDDLIDAPQQDAREAIERTYRNAAKRLHPDAGGSTREFQTLGEARVALLAHHGLNGTQA